MFNPVVTSLRGIQQARELAKVQKKLGCSRASLGSLSESATVFDAERLKEVISELGQELEPLARNPRLKDIKQTMTLVDGTLIAALPNLTQASMLKQTEKAIRSSTSKTALATLAIISSFAKPKNIIRALIVPNTIGSCSFSEIFSKLLFVVRDI